MCKRLVEEEEHRGLFCGKGRKSSGGLTSNSPGIANAILCPTWFECIKRSECRSQTQAFAFFFIERKNNDSKNNSTLWWYHVRKHI